MTDTQEPQRSLWLQVLWKPVFRSTREKVACYSAGYGWFLLLLLLTTYTEWLDSVLSVVVFGAGVLILHVAVLAIWLRWGRERFPLRSPDESPAA